jgi:hypothetical protein
VEVAQVRQQRVLVCQERLRAYVVDAAQVTEHVVEAGRPLGDVVERTVEAVELAVNLLGVAGGVRRRQCGQVGQQVGEDQPG